MTPLRVTVEISVRDERVWRLSEEIDPSAIRFGKAIPFDRGAQVSLRFELPGGVPVHTKGELVGESECSLDLEPTERQAILTYMREQR